MKIPYFPGCTLHAKARGFDASARAAAGALDIVLDELPEWTCCGAAFATAGDSAMGLVAPTRILASARPSDRLLTLCSFCYHTLKRTNYALAHDEERRTKVANFIEADYKGEVRPVHLLEVIRDEVGFETLAARVAVRLTGLKVAPYYGCLLLRPPEEMQFDDPERPTLLHKLLRALGCEVVEFPHATECCGSYLSVSAAETATECSARILRAAAKHGAQMLATSCPLCQYNLDRAQRGGAGQGVGLPVVYFTQLMALALRCGDGDLCFEAHGVDPRPALSRWLSAIPATA